MPKYMIAHKETFQVNSIVFYLQKRADKYSIPLKHDTRLLPTVKHEFFLFH